MSKRNLFDPEPSRAGHVALKALRIRPDTTQITNNEVAAREGAARSVVP